MLGNDLLAEVDAVEVVLVYLDQLAGGSFLDAWAWLVCCCSFVVMLRTHGEVIFWLEWAQLDRFFCLPVEIWQWFDGWVKASIGRVIDM